MKFNLAILALVGTISATQLTQLGDEKKGSPDNSRAIFEKSVATAAQVVATQQAFEKAKVADVAARNAKDTAEANALKLHVRQAANNNLMGKTSPDHGKQQWTGPLNGLNVQINEEPAAPAKEEAPKAAAPAKEEAPKQAEAEPVEKPNKNKKGSPQYSYDAKDKAVKAADDTVKQLHADMDQWAADHAANTAKAATETDSYSNNVKKGYSSRLHGDVDLPKK